MLYLVKLFAALFLCNIANSHDPPSQRTLKISPSLNNAFKVDESALKNVVVIFKQKPTEVLNMFDMTGRAAGITTEEAEIEMHRNFVQELKLMTKESQSEILQFLEGEASETHQSFWVTNQIFVQGASKELCEALGSFENVEAVEEEKIFSIHKPLEEGPVVDESRVNKDNAGINEDNTEWNIKKINAREAAQSGKMVKTCKVGIIDTGIRPTHEALKDVNIEAWHDAINNKKTPYDDNGHGSHVTGTITGAGGIGVAPGHTTLVCCKACSGSGSCPQSALTKCCQFMTEQKPNVVSNSWGGPGGDNSYTDILSTWRALNILSVFSAGNSGPSCGSVGSPADSLDAVSVGASTSDDGLADFSSRGQCKSGMQAPIVTAPGHQVFSAWSTSDTAYKSISGTSMAAPHVTGMYALMYSQNPGITVDQAKAALKSSCVKSGLQDPKQNCGGTSMNKFPNNMFGYGRIDCVNGMQFLREAQASQADTNSNQSEQVMNAKKDANANHSNQHANIHIHFKKEVNDKPQ